MKTSSAKAKGRVLQNLIRDKLRVLFPSLDVDDITSRPMGSSGSDIILTPAARKLIPCAFEAKNQESVNVWKSFQQAESNAGGLNPVLVIKRNRTEPLAVIHLDYFLALLKGKNE